MDADLVFLYSGKKQRERIKPISFITNTRDRERWDMQKWDVLGLCTLRLAEKLSDKFEKVDLVDVAWNGKKRTQFSRLKCEKKLSKENVLVDEMKNMNEVKNDAGLRIISQNK